MEGALQALDRVYSSIKESPGTHLVEENALQSVLAQVRYLTSVFEDKSLTRVYNLLLASSGSSRDHHISHASSTSSSVPLAAEVPCTDGHAARDTIVASESVTACTHGPSEPLDHCPLFAGTHCSGTSLDSGHMSPDSVQLIANSSSTDLVDIGMDRKIIQIHVDRQNDKTYGFSFTSLTNKCTDMKGLFVKSVNSDFCNSSESNRLLAGDQILAINGCFLDKDTSTYSCLLSLLQQAEDPKLHLIVARVQREEFSAVNQTDTASPPHVHLTRPPLSTSSADGAQGEPSPAGCSPHVLPSYCVLSAPQVVERTTATTVSASDACQAQQHMVIGSDWAQLHVIDLVNSGSGLGFGIIGTRCSGIIVKTIVSGGVAFKDGRLQCGDHVLKIGSHYLNGMDSRQVANVLRTTGSKVQLFIARPIDINQPEFVNCNSLLSPIIMTKILTDVQQLEEKFNFIMKNTTRFNSHDSDTTTTTLGQSHSIVTIGCPPVLTAESHSVTDQSPPCTNTMTPLTDQLAHDVVDDTPIARKRSSTRCCAHSYSVTLEKHVTHGLGVTVAGYICQTQQATAAHLTPSQRLSVHEGILSDQSNVDEMLLNGANWACCGVGTSSGIFVKSIAPGTAADLCEQIRVNDRIMEVDGIDLSKFTNQEAVQILRKTGKIVVLTLSRCVNTELHDRLALAMTNSEQSGSTVYTCDSSRRVTCEEQLEDSISKLSIVEDVSINSKLEEKWHRIIGYKCHIIDVTVEKSSTCGLGISLEGTVDVENGQEVRPHHYIRSVLPEGPIGTDGRLHSGDELLEANDISLYSLNHLDVVSVLKRLTSTVHLVCARRHHTSTLLLQPSLYHTEIGTLPRSILGGYNVSSALVPVSAAWTDGVCGPLAHQQRSHSVTCLTPPSSITETWSPQSTYAADHSTLSLRCAHSAEHLFLPGAGNDPQRFSAQDGAQHVLFFDVVLHTSEADSGFGFSILDYQDPLNANNTCIMVRSLVPDGVAAASGQLRPGDRLVRVDEQPLHSDTRLSAVVALLRAASRDRGSVTLHVCRHVHECVQERVTAVSAATAAAGGVRNSCDVTDPSPVQNTASSGDNSLYSEFGDMEVDQEYFNGKIVDFERLFTCPISSSTNIQQLQIRSSINTSPKLSSASPEAVNTEIFTVATNPDTNITPTNPVDLFTFNADASTNTPHSGETEADCRPWADNLSSTSTQLHVTDGDCDLSTRSASDSRGIIGLFEQTQNLSRPDLCIEYVTRDSDIHSLRREADAQISRSASKLYSVADHYTGPFDHQSMSASLRHMGGVDQCSVAVQAGHSQPHLRSADYAVSGGSPAAVTLFTSARALCSEEATHVPPASPAVAVTVPSVSASLSTFQPVMQPPDTHVACDTAERTSGRVTSCGRGQHGIAATAAVSESALAAAANTVTGDCFCQPAMDSLSCGGAQLLEEQETPFERDMVREEHTDDVSVDRATDVTNTVSTDVSQIEDTKKNVNEFWSNSRQVIIQREPSQTLGISIAGANIYSEDLSTHVDESGVFIRRILPGSLVHQCGLIKVGDRILSVNEVDFQHISTKEAIEFLSSLVADTVKLTVQSFILAKNVLSTDTRAGKKIVTNDIDNGSDVTIVEGDKKKILKRTLSSRENSIEELFSMTADETYMAGKYINEAGHEIDRASAAFIYLTAVERENDTEPDEFGYTKNKISKKYSTVSSSLMLIDLERNMCPLGISLSGHKDRNVMAVFICGLNPQGIAYKDGRLKPGDEIYEVNGVVLKGRCHLNASAIIKGFTSNLIKFLVFRHESVPDDMAIDVITVFPSTLADETPMQRYAKYRNLRNIRVKKGQAGMGIMIFEGKHAEVGQGIFISDIQQDSPAEQAGLCIGDFILCVNSDDLIGASYDTAAQILKRTEGTLSFWVCNFSQPDSSQETSAADKSSRASVCNVTAENDSSTTSASKVLPPPADPATAAICSGTNTLIELNRDSLGLGLSVIGGSDTALGSIIIHEVYPDGAAAKDGRLRRGDYLLEVGAEDFRNVTHVHALNVLRQTPAKIRLLVHRNAESSTADDDQFELIEVTMFKKSGKGFGLSIIGRKDGPGVFVSEVVKGGIADTEAHLVQGDQILSINGHDLKSLSQEKTAAILKTSSGKVNMQIGRLKQYPSSQIKPLYINGNYVAIDKYTEFLRDNANNVGTFPVDASDHSASSCTRLSVSTQLPLTSPAADTLPETVSSARTHPCTRTQSVRLQRSPDHGLGFSVVGGLASPHGDLPIYVKTVFERGPAAREGTLRRGTMLLGVNGRSLCGVTHQQAVALLRSAGDTVALLIQS